MISVCMAICDGEKFLPAQMESILAQLAENDEVVIVDDASSDGSREFLTSLNDWRIRLVRNESNVGVLKSFERALLEAKGEYIFFADQDDVWLDGKIEKTLGLLRQSEQKYGQDAPILVHTDLKIVNNSLHSIAESFWCYQNIHPRRGEILNRLLLQNVVTGCTVMINSRLRELALQIPHGAIMHDWWLALVAVLFGQVVHLDEPTILYRQHDNNSVGAKRWGLKQMVRQARSFEAVRSSMLHTMQQAQVLLDRYRDRMTSEQYSMIEAYSRLPFMSKAERVGTMVKYKFFKHGVIRTTGFLFNLLMLELRTQ
jgi:glycosyltransferase involved in cell wall biosynthesis